MRKQTVLVLFCLFLSAMLEAQEPKSATSPTQNSIPSPRDKTQNSTRAVVIGISDYLEPLISDLKYADRDAAAFADWLRSPAGLALPDSNIRLLRNKQATTAQMILSLDWLIEASRPDDRAFIYFSGHGDVERVTKFNLGYLLSYDSPPVVYGAGAFALSYLQAILTTLSENGVQVFVITDACRAGKLAGSSVGGTQATATQLAQQFAKEIKILSCQPDEFSLEGAQWGGGRGCFSYHLEDALYGLADQDEDDRVTVQELRRYLEDHVSAEAAPQSQTPMVSGPAQTKIATVREPAVAARKATRENRPTPFLAIENKGTESSLLEKADSSIRILYAQFLAAIDSGQLMSPVGRSANDYFNGLMEKSEMAALHGAMKRKFAAALLNEGQTIVNKVLQTDPQTLDNIWSNRVNYDHLPGYFERAAGILGEKHYAFRNLKAKEFYFRAMIIRTENYPDSSGDWRTKEMRQLLVQSLEWDSTLALTYYQLGNTFPFYSPEAISAFEKSVEMAPDWALIHFQLGIDSYGASSIYHFKKAIEVDSTFLLPYNCISSSYDYMGQKDSALFWRKLYVNKFFQKMAADSASTTVFEYNSLGNALWMLREYEKSVTFLLKAERMSAGQFLPVYDNLICVYTDLLEFENAIRMCNKDIAAYNKIYNGRNKLYNSLGAIYFYFLKDTTAATDAYAKAGDKYDGTQIQFHLAMGNWPKAYSQIKRWINSGNNSYVYQYHAAEAARQMGMPDTARYHYRQIIDSMKIEFYSINRPHYLFAALAYARLARNKELRQLLKMAKEKLNNDPWLYFNLACIYAQTNQEKAAIKSLLKAIELGWQPTPLIFIEGTLCDPMFYPICEGKPFKKLVHKHFPKYYKIATRVPGKH